MSRPIRLLVGLGNPGREYELTRHNAGFWWVDAYARKRGVSLRAESRYFGAAARTSIGGRDLWLLEPATYMNESGKSVAALARFYKIEPDEILVVHDELDLPPGAVRAKLAGGHGGHNGLRDIHAHLGTLAFWRLRIGIGHPGDRNAVVGYVLHRPLAEEQRAIDEGIERSLDLADAMIDGAFESVMMKLHSKPPKPAAGDAP